jgi:transposase
LHKAREYPNCKVILVTEEYTTMTCGKCGFLKKNIGKNKVYNCDKCNSIFDRDFNAARNILIKNII